MATADLHFFLAHLVAEGDEFREAFSSKYSDEQEQIKYISEHGSVSLAVDAFRIEFMEKMEENVVDAGPETAVVGGVEVLT